MEIAPPDSAETARLLIARMVENGLDAAAEDLDAVLQHLVATYTSGG